MDATKARKRTASKQPKAAAGPTPDEMFSADEADEAACTPPLDSETQQFQKVREEDHAISRLGELADASAEEAAKIILGAVTVLITPDDRKALQEFCATSGGANHYQKERSAILRILVQACSKEAGAALIGEHWLAIKKKFSQTPDRLRSALERVVDHFPRPVRKEWDSKHPAPAHSTAKPASVAPPMPRRGATAGGRNHGVDYRSVRWDGEEYSFTANQARCVKLLWESMEQGTPDVAGTTLRDLAEISNERFDLVFRGNAAWSRMIVAGARRGTYRLADEKSSAPSPTQAPNKKLSRGAKKRA